MTSNARRLSPREAAAALVAILEDRGATFTLRPDDTFACSLDGMTDIADGVEADGIARCVLTLRDEIRGLLLSQRTSH